MKPLKLKMQAFGSYGEETLIDFEKVNQNLFLITGDTGAGKTTIFDAIVFALYGEASSSANKKRVWFCKVSMSILQKNLSWSLPFRRVITQTVKSIQYVAFRVI